MDSQREFAAIAAVQPQDFILCNPTILKMEDMVTQMKVI